MSDFTYLVTRFAVIICCVLITGYIIPFIKMQVDTIKNERLKDLIKQAVAAVEQSLKNYPGSTKKTEVLNFIQAYLIQHNINITDEQLDKLIESAVYTLKQEKKG